VACEQIASGVEPVGGCQGIHVGKYFWPAIAVTAGTAGRFGKPRQLTANQRVLERRLQARLQTEARLQAFFVEQSADLSVRSTLRPKAT